MVYAEVTSVSDTIAIQVSIRIRIVEVWAKVDFVGIAAEFQPAISVRIGKGYPGVPKRTPIGTAGGAERRTIQGAVPVVQIRR